MAPMFEAGSAGVVAAMVLGMSLVGLAYGPLGTVLSELFPTSVRYTGSSLAFNLAGIFGASLAPYVATWLATSHGLQWVGYYLSASAVLSFIGLYLSPETCDRRRRGTGRPNPPRRPATRTMQNRQQATSR
jgi:MFS family permease